MESLFNFQEHEKKEMKFYFIAAFFCHLLFLLLFAFLKNTHFFDTNQKVLIEKEIRSAVRVDVVSMPKFTVKELKELNFNKSAKESKGQNVRVDENKVPLQPVKDQKEEESLDEKSEKIKAGPQEEIVDLGNILTKLSKKSPKKKIVRKKLGTSISSNELNALVKEGNKISKGESIIGDSLEESLSEFETYVSQLPSHVRPFWKLPSYLMERDLRCRIRIYLSKDGKLLRAEIIDSSGESEFDERAMRAIKKASPFPSGTSEIQTYLSSGKIVLGFPL